MPPMSITSSSTVLVHEPWASHSHPIALISSNRWPAVGKQWPNRALVENNTASVIVSIDTVEMGCFYECASVILASSEGCSGWQQRSFMLYNIKAVAVYWVFLKKGGISVCQSFSRFILVCVCVYKLNRIYKYTFINIHKTIRVSFFQIYILIDFENLEYEGTRNLN